MFTKNIFDLLFETYNKDNQFIINVQKEENNIDNNDCYQANDSSTIRQLIFLSMPSPSSYMN